MLPAGSYGGAPGVVDVSLQSIAGSGSAIQYAKFTSQDALGRYLVAQYHIRTPTELSSCRDVPSMINEREKTLETGAKSIVGQGFNE